jgi:hypothetical protein
MDARSEISILFQNGYTIQVPAFNCELSSVKCIFHVYEQMVTTCYLVKIIDSLIAILQNKRLLQIVSLFMVYGMPELKPTERTHSAIKSYQAVKILVIPDDFFFEFPKIVLLYGVKQT